MMAVFADGKQPPVRPPKCRNPRNFPVDSLRVERHCLALQDLNRVDQGDPELDEPAPRRAMTSCLLEANRLKFEWVVAGTATEPGRATSCETWT
jgi:hypothetical protein